MRWPFEGDRGLHFEVSSFWVCCYGGNESGTRYFRVSLGVEKVGVVRVIQLAGAHRGADAISRRGLIPVSRYPYILPVLPKSRVRCSIISKTQERY